MTLLLMKCCRSVCMVFKTYMVAPVEQLQTASDVRQITGHMKPLFIKRFFWPLLNHRWAVCKILVITHEDGVSFCFVAYSCNGWILHKTDQQVWILAATKTEQSATPFSAHAAFFLTGEGRSWESESMGQAWERYTYFSTICMHRL